MPFLKVDETAVVCPKCKIGKLNRVSFEGKPVSYYCTARVPAEKNCKLKFEVFDISKAKDNYTIKGKSVNPDYVDKLNSSSFAENISISAQLDERGVKYFLEDEDFIIEELSEKDFGKLREQSER